MFEAEAAPGVHRVEDTFTNRYLVEEDGRVGANVGAGALRFVALYAAPDVVTRYEEEVQPDGGRERSPVG